jgi:hypothetical protein
LNRFEKARSQTLRLQEMQTSAAAAAQKDIQGALAAILRLRLNQPQDEAAVGFGLEPASGVAASLAARREERFNPLSVRRTEP